MPTPNEQDAALIAAIDLRDAVAVKQALDAGADPNCLYEKTFDGKTAVVAPLLIAVTYGVPALVEALCADPRTRVNFAIAGNLLAHTQNLSDRFPKFKLEYEDIGQQLVRRASLNLPHPQQPRPIYQIEIGAAEPPPHTLELIAAIECSNPAGVVRALEKGADPNFVFEQNFRTGQTLCSPLKLAVRKGNLALIEALCNDERTDCDRQFGLDTALTYAIKASAAPDIADNWLAICAQLLRSANPDLACDGVTPWMLATQDSNLEVMGMLLEAGARAGVNVESTNSKGMTALGLAAQSGNVHVGEILIDHGAEVDHVTGMHGAEYSPMTWAIHNNEVQFVSLLARKGANLAHLSHGYPPLSVCLLYPPGQERVECLQELAACAAPLEMQDVEGNTPMAAAVKKGCLAAVESLTEWGASVQPPRRQGESTLLAQAMALGHGEIAAHLVERGAFQTDDPALAASEQDTTTWLRSAICVRYGLDENMMAPEDMKTDEYTWRCKAAVAHFTPALEKFRRGAAAQGGTLQAYVAAGREACTEIRSELINQGPAYKDLDGVVHPLTGARLKQFLASMRGLGVNPPTPTTPWVRAAVNNLAAPPLFGGTVRAAHSHGPG